MRSSFFELNIGSYGLFAAQNGLQVTSNNITNSNTVGYSRQVLSQKAGRALPGAGVGMIGTGVNIIGINRVRNSYLDMKIWNQKPMLGEYRVKSEQSALIEGVFGEPSDVGFTTIFNGFFDSLDNLSKIPDEGERKFALMQNMKSFTQYFNTTAQSLQKYQRDLNFEVKNKVDEINIIARRIESLNKQIYGAELYGGTANTLRDERELQIDRLAEIINVEVQEYEVIGNTNEPEMRYRVKINGQTLVDHFSARELDVKIREEKNSPEDVEGLYDVVWKDGLAFKMNDPYLSGELKGAIDMRDGNANLVATGEGNSIDTTDPTAYTINIKFDENSREDFLNEGYILINGTRIEYKDVVEGPGDTHTFTLKPEYNDIVDKLDTTKIEVQIGSGFSYRGIPYYIHRLDNFVREFAISLNKVYAKGVDEDGNDGSLLFGFNGMSSEQIKQQLTDTYGTTPTDEEIIKFYQKNFNASNFTISQDILDDVSSIRTTTDTDKLPSGNDLLLELMSLKHDRKMFREGEPNDYMVSIFSELGINAKEANMYKSSQENMTNAIENQRLSISQVDTNEEMLSLIKYQQAYQAAAKIISIMDTIYDLTINRMGAS